MPNVHHPLEPRFVTADRAARHHAPQLFSDHVYVPPIPPNPFDERVYDLIPIQVSPPKQPPKHISKYHTMVQKEYYSGTQKMASMGPLKIDGLEPKMYLKKGEGEKKKPKAPTIHQSKMVLKSPLPKELGIIPNPSPKDFVKSNRKDIVHSHPPPPPPEPRCYRHKKNYGRPPQYPTLSNVVVSSSKQVPPMTSEPPQDIELPEQERHSILKGLKVNWDKLNSEYQKLSLTVDTVPKITRKLNIEAQLKQLEEDIQRFSHEKIRVKLQ